MLNQGFGFVLLFILLLACNNNEEQKEHNNQSQGMDKLFKEITPPYQLSDTGFAKNKDTTTIPAATIDPLIPDSIKTKYFGKNVTIRYTALVKMKPKENAMYYMVKAIGGTKKAAFLLVFDKENNFGASFPFLLTDADPATSQLSVIDKNFTITKSVTQRAGPDITGEGKEVVAYDAASKSFSLIMTDLLHDNPAEISNPIDTFPKTNKLAGDYILNKKNIVSVRDGRNPNQLLVYIHTENKERDCRGELKGEFLMTSSSSAIYRQGGDPCVLNLNFSGNKVSIYEERGCGNYRGLDCPLSGSFTRKKQQPLKEAAKKKKENKNL